MVLVQKLQFFQVFFVRQKISKGVNQNFWPKNGHFFYLFFLGNLGQENDFYDILERKTAFLCYKNRKCRKS